METWHLAITGRVQGVGYRWFAREVAVKLGLGGFVRNLPDGSVEAVAQGPRAALDAFVAACKGGPSGSRVARVDATPLGATTTYTLFELRR